MKYHEIATQTKDELQAALRERRRHRDQLRFKVADDTSKNVRELRTVRKEIAKLLTALNKKVEVSGTTVPAPVKPVATPKVAVKKSATPAGHTATAEKK